MRRSYLITTAAGLLLALGGAAQAGHLGAGPPISIPQGFSGNPGLHQGFSSGEPKGWTSGTGAADWKSDATKPLPPGFTGTNSKPDSKP